MSEQGVNLTTTKPLNIGAAEDMDTLVEGFNNETTLGEKIETVVGGRAEGVGGLKSEVVAGAQVGYVGGIKYEVTYGYGYGYNYGGKYARFPVGYVDSVGTRTLFTDSAHTSEVGANFYLHCGADATISAAEIDFSGSTTVGLTCNTSANTSALLLEPSFFQLTLSPGPGKLFGLFVNQTQLLAFHPIAVNVGSQDSFLLANAAGVTINGPTTSINGALINLGQPVVTNANILDQLAAAQEAAAAEEAAAEEAEEAAAITRMARLAALLS